MNNNPWELSAGQCRVLEAITENVCDKAAAQVLGISPKTVSVQVTRARLKMNARNRLDAILLFDRWARAAA
jgi:DNA-binding NarL/FixJ family response regulator